MRRSHRRLQAFAGAALHRLATQLRRALTTDVDVTVDTAEAERVEAREFARSAGALRGGMAKVAQLQAYLEAPGSAVDADARSALAALWDRVPAAAPDVIRRVIEEDLGAAPEQLFAHFEDRPIAAASLGQVHAALGRDGTRLAVKVQYPGVADALRDDLESRRLLRLLAGSEVGAALTDQAIATLRAGILGELDYRSEAAAMEVFRRASTGDPQIVIPRSFATLSSGRVLTMERIEGDSLPAFAAVGAAEARAAVARVIFRFAWGAPVLHGLLNADPNPGNYLVLPRADGQARVGFVDFGCAGEIAEALRRADRALWMAMIRRDGEAMRQAVHAQGLVCDANVLDMASYCDWERALSAPFLARRPFELLPAHVRELGRLTSRLVRMRGMALPAAALLLWRQRLGALSVIASLRPRLDFRAELAALLDDGEHPVPLLQRYP